MKFKYLLLFGSGMLAGLFSPWIYDKFKNSLAAGINHFDQKDLSRFSPWISAHTGGMVLSGSQVLIRFQQSPSEEVRQKISDNPINFIDISPDVKVKAEWQDDKTLRLLPDEPLKNGEKYECKVELDKIFKVPGDCEEFEFSFRVVPKNLHFQPGVLEVNEDGNSYDFSGTIFTSDKIKHEELFSLVGLNEKLYFSWSHDPDGLTHRFIIKNIPRNAIARKMELSIKNWETHEKKVFYITIPGKKEFSLVYSDIPADKDETVIRMVFSDAISNQMPVESFITHGINDYDFKCNYVVQNNVVLIYPQNIYKNQLQFNILGNLKNTSGIKLDKDTSIVFNIPETKPKAEFVGNANIIPGNSDSKEVLIPFEAVNLKAVDVIVYKIFQNNLIDFFIQNTWDGYSNLMFFGQKVLKRKVNLNISNPAEYKTITRHYLNIKELVKTEPGCMYRVVLKFNKDYAACNCLGNNASDVASIPGDIQNEKDDADFYSYYSDNSYDDGNYDEYYDWNERNNPCHASYYQSYDLTKAKNILVSDLGIMVKRTTGKNYHVFVNDLNTTEALSGVKIEAYSLQKQLLGEFKTNSDGHAEFKTPEPVAIIVASKGKMKNYIRLDEFSLSTTMFETEGNFSKKGAKIFVYAERGVWRPGDTVFLGVMTHAREKNYFKDLPVQVELLNPNGNVVQRFYREYSENGLYAFPIVLPENANLGFWSVNVRSGPVTQNKSLRVDAIVPNRLKIYAKTDSDEILDLNIENKLFISSQWLAGPKASGLKYDVEYYLKSDLTAFEKYKNYCFSDQTMPSYQYSLALTSGYLDENGNAEIPLSIRLNERVPGMLNCLFKIRVFEGGGGFSSDAFSVKASPYNSYAGFLLPFNDNLTGYHYLECGKNHFIKLASLDFTGKPKPNATLVFNVHKLQWRWWWEKNHYGDAEYHSENYLRPVYSFTVKTNSAGEAVQQVNFGDEEWGRYVFSVQDLASGHVAAKEVYVDWSNWMARYAQDAKSSEIINLKADKEKYKVGDKAKIFIPVPENAHVLLTLENSNGILKSEWLKGDKVKNFEFEIKPEMFPNVYVYATVLQTRESAMNMPMRLYGLTRLTVDDPNTRLEPVIKMPDVLKPGQRVPITVSEKNGKDMEVTLAMVDEGLLDLTKFKTPDPLSYFSSVEAYVNRTWDIYGRVFGYFNADVQRILSVGGDLEAADEGSGIKRFKPMVRFVGPIKIKKGENKPILIQLPPYIGSVRTMVIAKGDACFGSAEKTTPVKSDLMILGQAPRFCGVEDEFEVPVWVFTGKKNMKDIKLSITVKEGGEATGKKEIKFSLGPEEQELKSFYVKAGKEGGMKIKISAVCGSEVSEWEVDIPILLTTPVERKTDEFTLESGKTFKKDLSFYGTSLQSTVQAEWSGLATIPFAYWMRQVKDYPYYCAEQLSSNALSGIVLMDILNLDKKEQTEWISKAIFVQKQLNMYLTPDGGLAYWQGGNVSDPWLSAHALYFIKWCEWKNIPVQSNLKSKLMAFNKSLSSKFNEQKNLSSCQYSAQAFRLWVLSLYNLSDIALMNALSRMMPPDVLSMYYLAMAYHNSGFSSMAKQLIRKTSAYGLRQNPRMDYCYNSELQTLSARIMYEVITNDETSATKDYNLLAQKMKPDSWLSSSELAYALASCHLYAKKFGQSNNIQFKAQWDNETLQSSGNSFAWSKSKVLKPGSTVKFSLDNVGKQKLNVSLVRFGKNKPGEEKESSNGFNVDYQFAESNSVSDNRGIEQGKDIFISAKVTYTGSEKSLNHVALEIPLPGGLEWVGTTTELMETAGVQGTDYLELRDTKGLIYFSINSGQSRVFTLRANAGYSGKFYAPAPRVVAMDIPSYYYNGKGKWIEVYKKGNGLVQK